MATTPLEQIYIKVSSFIVNLTHQLASEDIRINEIPIEQLKNIILTNFRSASDQRDPNRAFHQSVINTLSLIESAAQTNDKILCVSLLNLLNSQLKAFTEMETSWVYTSEYKDLFHEFELFSKKQWESKILLQAPHTSFIGKGVIYTAITGGYDNLSIPDYIDDTLDYICFTDNKELKSDFWNIRYIDNNNNLDSVRLARKCKILCTKYLDEYDFSIWIDGKIKITGDIKSVIDIYHQSAPILCIPHYCRDCVYIEGEVCISLNRGDTEEINRQLTKYRSEKYPEHNGLIESCVLFREHHNTGLDAVMADWWNEIKYESTRDQISFPYVFKKNNFNYDLCNFSIYNNPYFTLMDHNS